MKAALVLAMYAAMATGQVPSVITRRDPGVFRVVQIQHDRYKTGTAFLVPGEHLRLLTANHVVEGGGQVVVIHQGRPVPVMVVKRGSDRVDVAILMVFGETRIAEFSPLAWSKEKPKVGQQLWFMGWASGIRALLPGPATVVSTDSRLLEGTAIEGEYLAMSAPSLLPGHSGSPLVNERGEVVGMMVKGAKAGDNTPGSLQLAVPASVLKRFVGAR